MTYPAHVENGAVVLDVRVVLPEGVKIEVAVLDSAEPPREAKPFWKLARELAASIPDEDLEKMPRDGSMNLDHYLHGAPKREA